MAIWFPCVKNQGLQHTTLCPCVGIHLLLPGLNRSFLLDEQAAVHPKNPRAVGPRLAVVRDQQNGLPLLHGKPAQQRQDRRGVFVVQVAGGLVRQDDLRVSRQGAGETMVPMWISIICTIVVRLPLAYLLAWLTRSEAWPKGNPEALFASLLISWLLGMAMTVFAYKRGAWKRRLPQELLRQ